jgi:hypothetical protein
MVMYLEKEVLIEQESDHNHNAAVGTLVVRHFKGLITGSH